jgi:hypothetical protein
LLLGGPAGWGRAAGGGLSTLPHWRAKQYIRGWWRGPGALRPIARLERPWKGPGLLCSFWSRRCGPLFLRACRAQWFAWERAGLGGTDAAGVGQSTQCCREAGPQALRRSPMMCVCAGRPPPPSSLHIRRNKSDTHRLRCMHPIICLLAFPMLITGG